MTAHWLAATGIQSKALQPASTHANYKRVQLGRPICPRTAHSNGYDDASLSATENCYGDPPSPRHVMGKGGQAWVGDGGVRGRKAAQRSSYAHIEYRTRSKNNRPH